MVNYIFSCNFTGATILGEKNKGNKIAGLQLTLIAFLFHVPQWISPCASFKFLCKYPFSTETYGPDVGYYMQQCVHFLFKNYDVLTLSSPTQLFRAWNGWFVSHTATRGRKARGRNAFHAFGWLKWLMGSWDPVLLATARKGNINQILSRASLESGKKVEEGGVSVGTEHHLVEASPWAVHWTVYIHCWANK